MDEGDSPYSRVTLPRLPDQEMRILTRTETDDPAAAATRYQPLILIAEYTGPRFDELAASN